MKSHIDSEHILILTMMITGILLGQKAQLSEMSCYVHALQMVLSLISPNAKVVLLGDAEYDTVETLT